MTKLDIDKRVREIINSPVKRTLRNNMVLATVDDLAVIFETTLQSVQKEYGMWSKYAIKVVGGDMEGYTLHFPCGTVVEMKWGLLNDFNERYSGNE